MLISVDSNVRSARDIIQDVITALQSDDYIDSACFNENGNIYLEEAKMHFSANKKPYQHPDNWVRGVDSV